MRNDSERRGEPPDVERVEQIRHAALARDPIARDAFVAESCAGDDGLRHEVESLLRQLSDADGFLSDPAPLAAAKRLADQPGHRLIGRQLGVYHVESLLGAGGMGEVYRARDTALARDVAIKVLPRLFVTEPNRIARLKREARVLASLSHPHIGAIYGLEDVDGLPALVLELVEGATLAERLAKGPLPMADALTIARQLADALEAAHERGVVHCDLKPANIMITPAGAVRVLDFGLASVAAGIDDHGDPSQSAQTTIGSRDGTIRGPPPT